MSNLPEPAATKLIFLTDERDANEASARASAARLSQLPQDADVRLVEKIQSRRTQASNRHAELAALCTNLQNWLRKVRAPLEPVEPPTVQLAEGESVAQAVERVRDSIGSLQSRLQHISESPPPKAEDKRRAAELVAERLKRGRPRIDSRPDQLVIDHIDPQRMDIHSAQNDFVDLLAWCIPDLLLAAYTRDLDEFPQRVDALAPAERAARLAELGAQLELLERTEEALIERAASEGHLEIQRRADADPKCVLQVRAALRAQAVA
jgi:hypothetical protein